MPSKIWQVIEKLPAPCYSTYFLQYTTFQFHGITDEEEDDEDAEHEVDHGSDDEGWITPSNFKSKKLEMLGVDSQIEEEEKEIIVACLTSDFAMQNVLKQMGKCFEKMKMNKFLYHSKKKSVKLHNIIPADEVF